MDIWEDQRGEGKAKHFGQPNFIWPNLVVAQPFSPCFPTSCFLPAVVPTVVPPVFCFPLPISFNFGACVSLFGSTTLGSHRVHQEQAKKARLAKVTNGRDRETVTLRQSSRVFFTLVPSSLTRCPLSGNQ